MKQDYIPKEHRQNKNLSFVYEIGEKRHHNVHEVINELLSGSTRGETPPGDRVNPSPFFVLNQIMTQNHKFSLSIKIIKKNQISKGKIIIIIIIILITVKKLVQ